MKFVGEIKERQTELTQEQVDEILKLIMPKIEDCLIKTDWLSDINLDLITKEEFKESYNYLRTRLKVDNVFRESFLIEVRWLIYTVFSTISNYYNKKDFMSIWENEVIFAIVSGHYENTNEFADLDSITNYSQLLLEFIRIIKEDLNQIDVDMNVFKKIQQESEINHKISKLMELILNCQEKKVNSIPNEKAEKISKRSWTNWSYKMILEEFKRICYEIGVADDTHQQKSN